MTRAFIVKLDITEADAQFLAGMAEEIKESLESDGHIVLSVAPFAEPESGTDPTSAPLSLLAQKPLGI